MSGLLIIERFVIESLNKRERTLHELVKDTGLEIGIVKNILSNLKMRNIICFKDSVYSLNLQTKDRWLNQINSSQNRCEEIKELFTSLVNEYFNKEQREAELKYKKVFLTKQEEAVLGIYLDKVDSYLNEISKKKRVKNTKEQKIFVWGSANYGKMMDSYIYS